MLNVAVVGIGNIGQNHSRIYQAHPDTELVAVVDVVEAAAVAGGERFGVPHFTSISDLLASDIPVDMASVCTAGKENGGDHYEPTMALLGAGIPVLGEKPISNELPKAREMVALAQERNLRYGINLNHRFTPAAIRAKEWVDAGRLGELNIINMTMWINNPNETSEHFHMRALHPHSLDVMRYFAGDVEKVQAFFKKGKGRAIWSNVQVNLLFRNGVIGHLTGSYDAGGSFGLETLEVVGSAGRFVLREACQHLEFYPRHSMETESYAYLGGMMAFPETFDSRLARWIEQNKAGAAPEDIDASGEDALRVQTIIEGAIESWHTGKVVSV
ncbi:MAG: Gfo/Idh/MocA family oxidoreductase [Caldilineaceae bacterium SB0662_bin_9]|uniref:Gfo/Idh/MocA family oxidoreductase n=1 Tax=Caldilineaceae bacterium SB0662_bin_9 TaxID=2605258 RepID=A0A6B1DQZ2_9CHLR|nr:Gfo/Idh/MocA family oxidoreductase [Caldilineaceae bacterium]MYD89193.1 Gfo/Idh/MocA family oxidoreductase [Caldilineaceae bacterium SB0662_bin_9]